ncbi:MAG: poly(R)-hydroxyalkanoic acid synthase subunit PhaE [Rhodanobacter sp.]
MADPTSDFLLDYQSLARKTWDTWARQLQPSAAFADANQRNAGAVSANETLERTLDGVRGYMDWMQGTMASTLAPNTDWQQQLQQWFGSANPAFAQAFAGIDSAGAQGFAQQWQTWMQAAQRGGLSPGAGSTSPIPAFGLDREQQMQQQELVQAMLAAAQATARYHALLQRAGAEGMRRLQDKLAEHAEPGRQIESVKGLYDLWVDAAEEAYAEMALTDEFRTAYGEMVNTQMRVRQLQQKYTEALCQQLGVPTRSEVSSLGKRLQELRRDMRAVVAAQDAPEREQLSALRREVAGLKRQVGGQAASRTASKATPAKRSGSTRKSKAPKRAAAVTKRKAAVAPSKAPAAGKQAKAKRGVPAKASSKAPQTTKAGAGKTARSPSGKRK